MAERPNQRNRVVGDQLPSLPLFSTTSPDSKPPIPLNQYRQQSLELPGFEEEKEESNLKETENNQENTRKAHRGVYLD